MNSPLKEHRDHGPKRLSFAVVTVSSSRTLSTDTSGQVAEDLILASGHQCPTRRIVPDALDAIQRTVRELTESSEIDSIVLTGGTGFSPSDVTPEAVRPLFDRPIDGFGELFRQLSHAEIGAAAMLSRACAGTLGLKVVFALPGSPKAVALGLRELILPEVGHLLGQIRREE